MKYKEIIIQKIEYSLEDILNWIKVFGAKQLNITSDEITDEMIQIPIALSETNIVLTYTKETSSDNLSKEKENQ